MREVGLAVAALVMGVAVGCAQKLDLEAARAAIRTADLQFAKAVADRSPDRFLSFVADDATFFGGRGVSHGKQEVAASWAALLQEGGPTLTWAPDEARMSGAGDLGYTIGTYLLRSPGEPGSAGGRYVTIWRRQADGAWRVVVDIGTPPSPSPPDSTPSH